MTEENLFKALVTERRWTYQRFRHQFELAAQELAEEERDPRVRTLNVACRPSWNSPPSSMIASHNSPGSSAGRPISKCPGRAGPSRTPSAPLTR